jgi:carboxypeptidase Taq
MLQDVTQPELLKELRKVEPSLIRIEADEVTYNLHILLRFELELALINQSLTVEDLPAAWNEKMQKFLGITPPDDRHGVLQDVHWSAGLIGYFPTYTLGNIYAAQLMHAANRDLGGVDQAVARGEFTPLLQWLRERIHRFGRSLQPNQLIEAATLEPVQSEYLIEHLQARCESLA